MEILIVILGVIALLFGALVYSSLSWGFVVFKFYNWFILSLFIELPEITFVQAVGLALFISLFKTQQQVLKEQYTEKSTNLIMLMISPWVSLFIGWLIYSIFVI